MAGRAWYLAQFEKQLTGSDCAHANCNMAAAAMAVQQATLGAVNTSSDEMRTLSGTAWECKDNDKTNDGTSIKDAATAMARKGVHVTIFDATDGQDFNDVVDALKVGRFGLAHGDYDQVPTALRGDKDFLGYHSVFFHEYRAVIALYNGTKGPGIRVGDGLNDGRRTGIPNGYIWWPAGVAKNYMEKYPGGGLTFAIIDRRRVKARVAAHVRTQPKRTSTNSIRVVPAGTVLTWGAVQIGESVGGDRRWYRVWEPVHAKVGFMHASVVRTV